MEKIEKRKNAKMQHAPSPPHPGKMENAENRKMENMEKGENVKIEVAFFVVSLFCQIVLFFLSTGRWPWMQLHKPAHPGHTN